eukprot:PhM_4_TR17369/c2_g4_i1/m.33565
MLGGFLFRPCLPANRAGTRSRKLEDNFLDYYVVERHVDRPNTPARRGRSVELSDDEDDEDDDAEADNDDRPNVPRETKTRPTKLPACRVEDDEFFSCSEEDEGPVVISFAEADIMRRCAKLERETNFLDPEQWYVLVLGMDEKNEVERQLMRRFENMSHLSAMSKAMANRELYSLLDRFRMFNHNRDLCHDSEEWMRQTRRCLQELDVWYQHNDGHSEDYCRVLRNVHAQRELPAFLSDSRREAVQQAKIQGLVVDHKIQRPTATTPAARPAGGHTARQPATNQGKRGQRQAKKKEESDRLMSEYDVLKRLDGVPKEALRKMRLDFC